MHYLLGNAFQALENFQSLIKEVLLQVGAAHKISLTCYVTKNL